MKKPRAGLGYGNGACFRPASFQTEVGAVGRKTKDQRKRTTGLDV